MSTAGSGSGGSGCGSGGGSGGGSGSGGKDGSKGVDKRSAHFAPGAAGGDGGDGGDRDSDAGEYEMDLEELSCLFSSSVVGG